MTAMEEALGTTFDVFIIITIIVMGFTAYMNGQVMANTWRPMWQPVVYCGLLGLVDRFLTFALYEGDLLSLTGYLIDTGVLIAIALVAFQFKRAKKMVSQYPWLYEPVGLFGWRKIGE